MGVAIMIMIIIIIKHYIKKNVTIYKGRIKGNNIIKGIIWITKSNYIILFTIFKISHKTQLRIYAPIYIFHLHHPPYLIYNHNHHSRQRGLLFVTKWLLLSPLYWWYAYICFKAVRVVIFQSIILYSLLLLFRITYQNIRV